MSGTVAFREELRDIVSLPLPVLPPKLTGESLLASQYFLPTQGGGAPGVLEENPWKGQQEAELACWPWPWPPPLLQEASKSLGSVLGFSAQ